MSWRNPDAACAHLTWDDYLSRGVMKPGSWWTHWSDWLEPTAGKAIAARRKLGSKKYPVIEAAPGRYVKARA